MAKARLSGRGAAPRGLLRMRMDRRSLGAPGFGKSSDCRREAGKRIFGSCSTIRLQTWLRRVRGPYFVRLRTRELRSLEIQIEEGHNLEKALRQFRRKVQRAGILADMRRKRHYEKPSEAKRRKAKAAQRRLARNARRRRV